MSTITPDETVPLATVTEEIAASPSFVFETLLDADALPHWFRAPGGGRTHDWSLDPQSGGEWSARTTSRDGDVGWLGGSFIEVEAPHRLAFTWHDSANPEADGTVRFTLDGFFVEGEAWTRLTVTHATSCAAMASRSLSLSIDWAHALRALVQHVGESLHVTSC